MMRTAARLAVYTLPNHRLLVRRHFLRVLLTPALSTCSPISDRVKYGLPTATRLPAELCYGIADAGTVSSHADGFVVSSCSRLQ